MLGALLTRIKILAKMAIAERRRCQDGRIKITAGGKVKYQQAGKRHGMIKRTTKQIREHRGTAVLFKTDGDNVKKYWMPNG